MKKVYFLLVLLFSCFQTAFAEENITEYACDDIYAPVCASLQVECIMAPCYPVMQTFGNRCEMDNNSRATFLYEGICLGTEIENILIKAWESVYTDYSANHNDISNGILLEQLANKADKLGKESDSLLREAAYNYLGNIVKNTLRKEIFEPFIYNNFSSIAYDETELGGSSIDWESLNTAIVYYEDGDTKDSVKINIVTKTTGIEMLRLEDKIDITQKYKDKIFEISLKVPTTWDSLYGYKFSDNYIDFYYKAKREADNTLFKINIFTKPEWKEIQNIDISMQYSLVADLGDFVIANSSGEAVLYKTDENISNFSIMRNEIQSIIDTIEVYYR